MSEPLSAERFEQFIETYTENHGDHTRRLEKIEGRLDSIDGRLDKIDARLGNIETLLWQGHVIEEMQQRIMGLAHATGNDKFAEPFIAPPGLAQPVR